MGKTADNEKLKLDATFQNNLAAASVIAGVLAPYFALLSNIPKITDWIQNRPGQLAPDEFNSLLIAFGTFAAGLGFAWILRSGAEKTISEMKDD